MARAWAESGQDEELKALGLTDEDLDVLIEVFPENWLPFIAFDALATQWVSDMGVKTGLNYAVINGQFLKMLGVKKKQQREVFWAIREMEREALLAWQEEREAKQANQ